MIIISDINNLYLSLSIYIYIYIYISVHSYQPYSSHTYLNLCLPIYLSIYLSLSILTSFFLSFILSFFLSFDPASRMCMGVCYTVGFRSVSLSLSVSLWMCECVCACVSVCPCTCVRVHYQLSVHVFSYYLYQAFIFLPGNLRVGFPARLCTRAWEIVLEKEQASERERKREYLSKDNSHRQSKLSNNE